MAAERLRLRLLGRPTIEAPDGADRRLRSRKSWALLAYLVLTEIPPTRSRLAALLFAEADDPLRALRWCLAELRRCLGDYGSLEGDPVRLRLRDGVEVDVDLVARAPWIEAVAVPGLGEELLEGIDIQSAPAFESWLLAERRRLAGVAEAVLHEAALGFLARGMLDRARRFAVRAAAMSPLDENHQAMLIRLYRRSGDDDAAERQYAAFRQVLRDELGTTPGPVVESALRERRREARGTPDAASVEAVIEAGAAAVSAGAVDAGLGSLRTAVALADDGAPPRLRVRARLVLAEGLIHSIGGLDEEGLAHLHEADRLAVQIGDHDAVAYARAELGYVDYLRARYQRAEQWLTDAAGHAPGSVSLQAKVATYLGSVASDRGNYPQATSELGRALHLARAAGEPRREAYALSMVGRIALLRGNLEAATTDLRRATELAERDHWLFFLPWPQALAGEIHLERGEVEQAAEQLQQASARAVQLGDPCWEGMATRGLALLAAATGEVDRAFARLADARSACHRYADPYVWLDAYILDALCALGRRHDHPETREWAGRLTDLASRTGMRELTVRALHHAAALGEPGASAAARLLAADVDNPALHALLAADATA
jgi:DNA-binding SARP family transcriptional activator